MNTTQVLSVARDGEHRFSKVVRPSIRLLAGLGVEGDAHLGVTVQHRSRVAVDPTAPNLRQVHLIAAELLEELAADGFTVAAGELGENVLTRGVDLLGLPEGTVLGLGDRATIRVTGLRNPCRQINGFTPGLMKRLVSRGPDGELVRRGGVMAVVLTGGTVAPGDPIRVTLADGPPLRPV